MQVIHVQRVALHFLVYSHPMMVHQQINFYPHHVIQLIPIIMHRLMLNYGVKIVRPIELNRRLSKKNGLTVKYVKRLMK